MTKGKTDKLDFVKIKSFCASKETIKKVKKPIASKAIKHFEIKGTKEMKNLYTENHKTLIKKK